MRDIFLEHLSCKRIKGCTHEKVQPIFLGDRYHSSHFCSRCGAIQRGRKATPLSSVLSPRLSHPIYALPNLPIAIAEALAACGIDTLWGLLSRAPRALGQSPIKDAPADKVAILASLAIKYCNIKDPIQASDLAQLEMLPIGEALQVLHGLAPGEWLKALRRVEFQQLVEHQYVLLNSRETRFGALPIAPGQRSIAYLESLPYKLTDSQRRVLQSCQALFGLGSAANILVQGDVGSGKTTIAVLLALQTAEARGQTAIVAPTSVLAEQHYNEIKTVRGLRAELLVGGMTAGDRRATLKRLSEGTCDVVVGTHALFSESVKFRRLSLVVFDEQHKFGVAQRATLLLKGIAPHAVSMTATPIPRSLAMATHAGEILVNGDKPGGRLPIITELVNSLSEVDIALQSEIKRGGQAYVVASLVSDSETEQLAAEAEYARLAQYLPRGAVELLHGQMSPDEKAQILRRFQGGGIKILVSTSVIEVGVNNPNANTIAILDADRHGLAGLHQMRGRVGRGKTQGYCLLHSGSATPKAIARLKVLVDSEDGFYIADKDLETRGAGETYGSKQSGFYRLSAMALEEPTLLAAARAIASKLA